MSPQQQGRSQMWGGDDMSDDAVPGVAWGVRREVGRGGATGGGGRGKTPGEEV